MAKRTETKRVSKNCYRGLSRNESISSNLSMWSDAMFDVSYHRLYNKKPPHDQCAPNSSANCTA